MERSLRVLVVDDEEVSRGVLESYLAADGHRVMAAIDAEKAIGCLAAAEFDLMITDYAIPGINGVQRRDRAGNACHPSDDPGHGLCRRRDGRRRPRPESTW